MTSVIVDVIEAIVVLFGVAILLKMTETKLDRILARIGEKIRGDKTEADG